MLTLDTDGSQLVITGDRLDRDVALTINGIHAAGFNTWTLPLSIPTFVNAKRVVEEDGGQLTPAAVQMWEHVQDASRNLLSLKDETKHSAQTLGTVEIAPEQEADAQFVAAIGSGWIFHPPRFGKTRVWMRVLDLLDKWPVLIAVKPKTIRDIESQLRDAFPNRSMAVLSSGMNATQRKKELAKNAEIVIVAHNLLELHSAIASYGGLKPADREKERTKGKYDSKELNDLGFRVVVFDEAHRAQSPKAATTRAAWVLGDVAEHRIMATGTPAPNSEDEFWGLLRFCYPKLFPSKNKFINHYVNMVLNMYGRKEPRGFRVDHKEDWDCIYNLMHVRREKVGGPGTYIRHIPVELDKDAQKRYKQLVEHNMTEVGGDLVVATDSMTLRHRLIQFASGTPVLKNDKVVALDMPSAKIDALLEWLKESDEKAIVVSFSRPLADLAVSVLNDKGFNVVSILGGQSADEAYAAQQAIQVGNANVIVMSGAGAEGIELSKATRIAMLVLSDDLVANTQIEMRNTSRAQESSTVELAYIYAKGTIDEAIQESYIRKDERLHNNLNDSNWLKRHAYGDVGG